ncbi:hypothetical protein ACA910_002602 [Epithemia clementina (nom. ined.)]
MATNKDERTWKRDGYDNEKPCNGKELLSRVFRVRGKMASIEDAWAKGNDSLWLRHIQLDRFAANFLLQKLEARNVIRNTQGTTTTKKFRSIVLDECWFSSGYSAHLMIIFLHKIKQELRELCIVDGCIQTSAVSVKRPLGFLLSGVRQFESLERLVLERVDLRGGENGFHLRCILARNASLKALHLFGCIFDECVYEQFLTGITFHSELRSLDMGGCYLSDRQLERLIDALIHNASFKKLKVLVLDLTCCSLDKALLKNLTRLMRNCFKLKELILCASEDSGDAAGSESPYYGDFVESINAVSKLKGVGLGHCKLPTPIFQSLGGSEKLRMVQDRELSRSDNKMHVTKELQISVSKALAPCTSDLSTTDFLVASGLSYLFCN